MPQPSVVVADRMHFFFSRLDDPIRLIAESLGHLAMPREHLTGRKRQLCISGTVRRDLRRARACVALLRHVLFDLLAARAAGFQILRRVAPDLRRAVFPWLDLIAEFLQAPREFTPIDRRAVLLATVKLPRLNRVRLAVFGLSHVEEHRVRVKLRRGIAVNRPRAVMLELRHHPFAAGLGRSVAAHARLDVMLHFIECGPHGRAMRLSHPLVTANKRGQRNTLRRAERGVPSGAVLQRLRHLARFVHDLVRLLIPDELLGRLGMLAGG